MAVDLNYDNYAVCNYNSIIHFSLLNSNLRVLGPVRRPLHGRGHMRMTNTRIDSIRKKFIFKPFDACIYHAWSAKCNGMACSNKQGIRFVCPLTSGKASSQLCLK